jgi:MFS family permease
MMNQATLLGPALAPVVGGAMSRYYSWRIMQLALGIGASIVYTIVIFSLPETSHPGSRGVDKDPRQTTGTGRKFVILNPFRCLQLLQSPNIFNIVGCPDFP